MADAAPKTGDDENAAIKEARQILATIPATPAKPYSEPAAAAPRPTAKMHQLPLWPEPVRGAPNSFLRSALFAAIQGKTRRYMEKALLASIQGVSVRFTGKQLDQSDLDVWEQAVHLARQHPLGNVCHVTIYAFLKALGRSTGKSDYQWLDDVITRLVACEVRLKTKDKEYGGNLIAEWKRDDTLGSYKITLNATLVKLYGWNDWTAVDWNQRQSLRGKPLALWLHGFYSSHAQPFPIKVETLHLLSGSTTKNLRHFKANLEKALDDLEAATGIKGTIEGDLVTVERHGSRTQLRHLRRKSAQRDATHGKRRRRKTSGWRQAGELIDGAWYPKE
jgi:TrfA protein